MKWDWSDSIWVGSNWGIARSIQEFQMIFMLIKSNGESKGASIYINVDKHEDIQAKSWYWRNGFQLTA